MDSSINRPLVSIIVAAHNAESYIIPCLKSIQNQTYPNLECFVIDDGSEDNTYSVAQEFASHDARFKVIKCAKIGVSRARNTGLKLASGEFVTFLDSDDQTDAHYLEKALQKIKDADLFIAGINNVFADDEGNETALESWSIPEMHFKDRESLALHYVREHKLLLYSPCNKLYRNSILKSNNILFNENVEFGEDRIFNYTYLLYADNVITTDECLYFYYHRNRSSLSTKFRKFHIRELLYLHQEKINWLKSVLGHSHEDELESFSQYDITKEYNNAQTMLLQNKNLLSEAELKEEYEVLEDFRNSYPLDRSKS